MMEKIGSPDLEPGLALYVNAFLWLDDERHSDFKSIPWSAIIAYCNEYGLMPTQRDNMLDYVRAIDNAITEDRYAEWKRTQDAS